MSGEVRIVGLTSDQVKILDQLWNIDTEEELREFYNLSSAQKQEQIDVLTIILIQEMMEENITEDYYSVAHQMLTKIGVKL